MQLHVRCDSLRNIVLVNLSSVSSRSVTRLRRMLYELIQPKHVINDDGNARSDRSNNCAGPKVELKFGQVELRGRLQSDFH